MRDDEISILNGVLELNTKTVVEIMTPMKDVVTLSSDAIMDHAMVDKMSDFSLSPSVSCTNVCGFQLNEWLFSFPSPRARESDGVYWTTSCEEGENDEIQTFVPNLIHSLMQLLIYDPSEELPVSSFSLSILPEAGPDINCFQALDYLYVLVRNTYTVC